jgi:hypothetical protein
MANKSQVCIRGLETNRTGQTPDAGSFLYTTDLKQVWVGDGSTGGGIQVSNATHTGQVTGAIALALDVTAITDQPTTTNVTGTDTIIINDGGVLSELSFNNFISGQTSSIVTPATGDALLINRTGSVSSTLVSGFETFFNANLTFLKPDGSVGLTSDWDVGAFDLTMVDLHVNGVAYFANTVLTTDDQFYMYAPAADQAAIVFDANDLFYYDRTDNDFNWVIGGATVLDISATQADFKGVDVVTLGDGKFGGTTYFGNSVFTTDDQFFLSAFSNVIPRITFDVNDYIQFDRTANEFVGVIGGVTIFELDTTDLNLQALDVITTGNFGSADITATGIGYFGNTTLTTQNQFYLGAASATVSRITFDSTDYISYDRTANEYSFSIANVEHFTLNNALADFNVNVTTGGFFTSTGDNDFKSTSYFGNDDLTTQNQFWLGAAGVADPRLNFDSGDYIRFDRTNNWFEFEVASVTQFTLSATLADFLDNDIATTGDADLGGTTYFANTALTTDDQFFASSATNVQPRINWDTNDHVTFFRGGNRWDWDINNVVQLSLDATKLDAKDNDITTTGVISGVGTGITGLRGSKGITIADPVAADDATLFFTSVAITVGAVHSHITAGTNVVFNVHHAATRTGTGLLVFTANITLTSTAGQTNNSGFTDATIPANSWVWLDIVSVSGAVTMFHATVDYTED